MLIAQFGFDPQQAGGLVTLFLVGAVIASMVVAPRFRRLAGRRFAPAAFACSAAAFFLAAHTRDFATLAASHALGGLAAGTALSITHGTIGRSSNPHRLFGLVQLALGVFAAIFLAATPKILVAIGGSALFWGVLTLIAIAFTAADTTGHGDHTRAIRHD